MKFMFFYLKECLDCFVFNGVFSLEASNIEGQTRENDELLRHNSNGVLEVRDDFSFLFGENRVSVEEIVLKAFRDSEFGGDLVFEVSSGEAKSREFLRESVEESSAVLGLEIV